MLEHVSCQLSFFVIAFIAANVTIFKQGHDAVNEGKFHVALRTLRVVKRLRLRSLCTVGFGLYVEKRLPLLVDRLFAATLQVLNSPRSSTAVSRF